jgi:DNA-binding NarL/FixJ family response regulator
MVDGLRILIADDHPLFRDGLRSLVASVPGAQVVGEAHDGEAAVRLTDDVRPDVVLMDLQMPGMNGIDATRRIVERDPRVGVLVLTMFEDDDSVFAAMRAGARGYLLKGAGRDEVVRAMTAVANGDAIFSASIARRLMEFFARPRRATPTAAFPALTDREHEVLEMIARGDANPVIAARLGLSPKTIRNHVSNIFNKLQVADRAQAIVRARNAGLGTSDG